MALYFVGNGTNWSSTSSWATSSGGASGAPVPTSTDDVFFDVNSPGSCTIDVTANCQSITCTGFTHTLTHNAAITLSIGSATAGAGNVALLFVAGMTYTLGSNTTSVINFVSTSATVQTITTGGKTLGTITINGVGSSYQLADTNAMNSASTLTLTNGTLNTNGQTCSWGLFALGAGTKTLTLGASTVTMIGAATSWNTNTNGTGLTLNAGTSSLVFASGSTTGGIACGGFTFYNVSCTASAGGFNITSLTAGGSTFNNFTMDNTVLGGGNRPLSLTTGGPLNITGTFTYKANNATAGRGLLESNVLGTTFTVALGTTGTAALTDIDLADITFTGTNTPVTAAAGRLGNCGNNSGVTTQTPTTFYYIGNGTTLSSATNWSTSSGGASAGIVPLPQDTAIFDTNSFTSAVTLNNDLMRIGTLDFSAVTQAVTYNPINPAGGLNAIFGNFILKTIMSYTCTGAAGGVTTHRFSGRASYNLNYAGLTEPSNVTTNIFAYGGTYTLQSNFVNSGATMLLTYGTFTANGFNVTVPAFSGGGTNPRTLNMGSGTWTMNGTGSVWSFATIAGLTINANTSTLVISDTSVTSKTLAHGGAIVMNNITITGGGTGAIIFGTNVITLNNLTVSNSPTTLTFTSAGPSTTIINGTFAVSGTPGNLITINASTPGSQAFLSKPSGVVSCNYLSLQDSKATGGAVWYAGVNSTNVSNNTGWAFTTAEAGNPTFFMMGGV